MNKTACANCIQSPFAAETCVAQLMPGTAVPRLHKQEHFVTPKQQGSSPFSILMPGTPGFKKRGTHKVATLK